VTVSFGATYYFRKLKLADVDLSYADLGRATFHKCEFSNVLFQYADCSGWNDSATHFTNNCRFKGELQGVWFRGYYSSPNLERRFGKTELNPMRNIDFSEAKLWDVGFNNGCDLSTVIPPQDGEHFLFDHWPKLLNMAQSEVSETWRGAFRESAMIWLSSHKAMLSDQPMYLIHRRELEQPIYADPIRDATQRREFAIELVAMLQRLEQGLHL
jgi:uncharacterized protein YjbI with pentapeptide repeats